MMEGNKELNWATCPLAGKCASVCAQLRPKPSVQRSQAVKTSLQEAVLKDGLHGECKLGPAVALPREHDITVLLTTSTSGCAWPTWDEMDSRVDAHRGHRASDLSTLILPARLSFVQ